MTLKSGFRVGQGLKALKLETYTSEFLANMLQIFTFTSAYVYLQYSATK